DENSGQVGNIQQLLVRHPGQAAKHLLRLGLAAQLRVGFDDSNHLVIGRGAIYGQLCGMGVPDADLANFDPRSLALRSRCALSESAQGRTEQRPSGDLKYVPPT